MKQTLQKTIKIPVSDAITNEKLSKLNRLTARLTYGVQLFLDRIVANDVTTVKEAEKFRKEVEAITGLPSAFAQACRDKALWMYKSYKKQHKEWEKKVSKLERAIERCKDKHKRRKLERKLYRLRKKEPSLPTVSRKIPVMFDYRIGSIEFSYSAKEFRLWMRISTLEKGKRIVIPLHSYSYAEKHLKSWSIKSFQIVWKSRLKRYEVHVVVEKEVIIRPKKVVGIDLGLKRLVTAYEQGEDSRAILVEKSEYKEFFIRMRELNNRIAKLQSLGKIRALKKLRRKRRNIAADFRRKLAVEMAKQFNDAIVFIGLPKDVRTDKHYKGSGNKRLRKRVNHWAFREFAVTLQVELMENNNLAYIVNEHGSTRRCSVCGSKKVQVDDREFLCLNCGHKDDRDVNAAKNILKFGLERLAKVSLKGTGAAVSQLELPMMRLMPLKVETPSVRAE
ncbi:RNA-guided endonuclease TnpB family protein [Archaeoglobus veneficus]|nr:RNA-guided endonuclease TnpB family protein [Archaeoglobus veneficus]